MTSPNEVPDLICVIDDDADIRGSLDSLLRAAGFAVRTFAAPDEFLASADADQATCLLLDIRLHGTDGLDFQQALAESSIPVPVILITGHGDIPMTVRGMRAGAVNFLSKPIDEDELLRSVQGAVAMDRERRLAQREGENVRACYGMLTPREQEVMSLVTAGLMNKQVAGRLGLSEITVKIHRGNLMRKMQAQSLADLVRMAEELGARNSSVARYPRAG
ncbi:response regulator transcription factor [Mesorhizobium neociceri]|uniref:Response regulator transcription factor n=1 Tax=Mesorhizobium neociceri TaxID=1307853 RepID=A0A838AYK6_9HYPH|nr:response regulator [Mesorhizobium neociceri]MBA1138669.1 response regulator transcription factor [Mesorhizobium neociceri]